MKSKTELLPGEIFASSSGSLPCKLIIHAVGPKWKGGRQGEQNELFEAIAGRLEEVDRHAMKSIAIPIISSGIYGFPLDEATKVICEAIVEYFKTNKSSGIKEIHLVDNKTEGGKSFINALKKHLPDGTSHQAKKGKLLAYEICL